jgi:PAS domain-containing protein
MTIDEMDLTDAQKLRMKAEDLLKKKQEKKEKLLNEADAKKLLHELQVHQIELEMQNDELRMANETVEQALKKYIILYDLAPMGFLTLDSDGRICDLNFTAANMLDDKRFHLENDNFNLYIFKDSKQVFDDFFSRIYRTNSKESCEVKLGYNSKILCTVYMEGVVTGEDMKCLLSLIDITSFKK